MAENSKFVSCLLDFGLSRQEAQVYEMLLRGGRKSGYEVAKGTGISRSNAYAALAALVEKGAAYLVEDSAKRYIAVLPDEFCGNRIRRMKEEKRWLSENLPGNPGEEEGYITIEGENNIYNKVVNLLLQASERVYFSGTASCLETLRNMFAKLISEGKKVVLITDGRFEMEGAIVYRTEDKGCQIGLITDSRFVLSGEFGPESSNNCLYSGQKNFVRLFKNALANEIKLIRIQEGENNHEKENVCDKRTD